MNIYVGNLSLDVTKEELLREFEVFGQVTSVTMMNNKYIGSGQTGGYGFVEMASKNEAEVAVYSLNGKKLRDTVIEVVGALPLTDKVSTIAPQRKKTGGVSAKVRQRI